MWVTDKDLQLVQVAAALATVAGVVFGAWQIGLVKKRSKVAFEDGLSQQYRRIIGSIPLAVWLGTELKALSQGTAGPLPRRDLSLH